MDNSGLRYIFSTRLSSLLGPNKKMSQRKLADLMGVRPNTVSDWCNGKTFPGYDTVDEISETLNISSQWLFGAEEKDRDQLIVESFKIIQNIKTIDGLQAALEALKTIEQNEIQSVQSLGKKA